MSGAAKGPINAQGLGPINAPGLGGLGGPKGPEGPGGPGNMFGQLVNFFNDIDKMVNGFADGAEGKGKGEDKGDSLLNLGSKLNDMFSGINKAFGGNDNVGHRLGMAQANKEQIGQLFNSDGHGNGAINRIGDAGEGSGNFNAVSFMSSMSNSVNDALSTYKEVQEKVEQQEAKEESKDAVEAVA